MYATTLLYFEWGIIVSMRLGNADKQPFCSKSSRKEIFFLFLLLFRCYNENNLPNRKGFSSMSEPDVFSQIRIHYNAFSKGKKKIAQYILDHPEQILPLSITQFAQVCGVGDASISRFCQSIGYKGYQDFKLALHNK